MHCLSLRKTRRMWRAAVLHRDLGENFFSAGPWTYMGPVSYFCLEQPLVAVSAEHRALLPTFYSTGTFVCARNSPPLRPIPSLHLLPQGFGFNCISPCPCHSLFAGAPVGVRMLQTCKKSDNFFGQVHQQGSCVAQGTFPFLCRE